MSFAQMACSMARSLELIGDWWTPLIIRDLYLGLDRFDAGPGARTGPGTAVLAQVLAAAPIPGSRSRSSGPEAGP